MNVKKHSIDQEDQTVLGESINMSEKSNENISSPSTHSGKNAVETIGLHNLSNTIERNMSLLQEIKRETDSEETVDNLECHDSIDIEEMKIEDSSHESESHNQTLNTSNLKSPQNQWQYKVKIEENIDDVAV